MIGRNDPCPCGSGKKYKKCCAVKSEVTPDTLVESELERVILSYFEYATDSPALYAEYERYERSWKGKLQNYFSEDEVYSAVMGYFLFVLHRDLWNRHLVKTLNGPIRPPTRSVLEGWKNPIVLLAKITSVAAEHFYVEELLGHQTYSVHKEEDMNPEEGQIVFGIVLADNRNNVNGVYVIDSISIISDRNGSFAQRMVSMAEESKMTTSHDFFKAHMIDIYIEIIESDSDEVDAIIDRDLLPIQQEVIKILEEKLDVHNLQPQFVEFIKMVAIGYFMQKPNFRKPEVIAAAIFQVMYEVDLIGDEFYSQEDIAKMFGVSVSLVKKHIENIYNVLNSLRDVLEEQVNEGPTLAYWIGTDSRETERMNWEMHCKASALTFDSLEDFQVHLDKTMNQPFQPIGKKQEAQALAYEAYDAKDAKERIQLAKKVLALDSKNVDAALFQVEMAKSEIEEERYFKEAIRLGEAEYDSEPESPWALVTNRPYMRAIFSYGIWLYEKDRFAEAFHLFEQLLEMNPDDNQGARYLAISSAIKNGVHFEAVRLLDDIEEHSSEEAAYLFLKWLLEVESKDADMEKADEILEDAEDTNMFVLGLLEDRMPKLPYPKNLSISPGSMDEAMYIWYLL